MQISGKMKSLLVKLNYKGQKRIALINAENNFSKEIAKERKDIQIDKEIDPRYPYEFMIIFAKSISEIEFFAPIALHNLLADGVLWFCYPKKSSKKYTSGLERDNVGKALSNFGFNGIRLVGVDENWSAMRFRNVKYIRSVKSSTGISAK